MFFNAIKQSQTYISRFYAKIFLLEIISFETGRLSKVWRCDQT